MGRADLTEGNWFYKNGAEWVAFSANATKQLDEAYKRREQGDTQFHINNVKESMELPAEFLQLATPLDESVKNPTFRLTVDISKDDKMEMETKVAKRWDDVQLIKEHIEVKREEKIPEDDGRRGEFDKKWGVTPLFPFPHVFSYSDDYGNGEDPYTLIEQTMMQISSAIRDKPGWETKSEDPKIQQKWKTESSARADVFKYVIDELKYYKALKNGPIEVSAIDGLWQADGLISEELRQQLLKGVAKLENVPDSEKDWHPGSNGQVLDLVHPSLFCYVAGATLASFDPVHPPFKYIGGGEVAAEFEEPSESMSKWFQWLPSDVRVDDQGKVSFLSYINNLHPVHHAPLYGVLAKILEQFVPMFENVLADLRSPRPRRYNMPSSWYEEFKDYKARKEAEEQPSKKPHLDKKADDFAESRLWDEYQDNRQVQYPPIPEFVAPNPPKKVNLRGRQLQVIIKLANIILTPEKPKYDGGVWHVEGMENESIVASGIYYYYSENISESRLAFRTAVCEPQYEQGDDRGVEEVYGLSNEGELNQSLGSVVTKEGRALAFPNLYQHQVQPFSLVDKTKPGHRKILVFFLVDPSQYINSTLFVAPQQPEWRAEHLAATPPFNKIPKEIVKQIMDLSSAMTLEDAKQFRADLMKERKVFVDHNNQVFEREFSLCEH